MRTLHQSRSIGQNEFKKLSNACKNKSLLRAMILMYYGGFRVNEVKQITNEQISQVLKTGEIDIYISKQKIKRVVYFNKNAIQELYMCLANTQKEHFLNYTGDSLRVLLNKFIKNILGDGYTSHGFRRGFITTIIQSSGNPKLAQYVIGHKNINTTLHYDDPSLKDIKEAYSFIQKD